MSNIGSLNRRIRIYRQEFISNAETGTKEPVFVLHEETWAGISPRTGSMLNGREAGTILSQTTHVITVRSRGDLKPEDRIKWTDEYSNLHEFSVDYILPPNGNQFMMIYVREVI